MAQGHFWRIVSNFARLGLNFAIGVLIVRLLLRYDAATFATYSLIVVGIGLGAMLKELSRIAVVPNLSRSYGSDPEAFRQAYASSFIVSGGFALVSMLAMLALVPLLSAFSIPDDRLADAELFLVFRAVQNLFVVGLSPVLNMMLVSRRFVWANGLLVSERCIDLIAVLSLVLGWSLGSSGLAQVGMVSLIGMLTLYALFIGFLLVRLDELRPRWSAASLASARSALSLFGWTVTLVIAMNLYLRFDILFVNYFLGVIATAAFALAVQATGMVQQVTNGVVSGLDASFAHDAKGIDGKTRLRGQLRRMSQLQASVSLALAGVFLLCTDELLALWVGRDALPAGSFSTTSDIILLMVLGIVARGFSEIWMNALNGLGKIGSYAPWLMTGAFANPVLVAAGAFWLMTDAPLIAVAAVFLILHVLSYGGLVAWVASRQLAIPLGELYSPLTRPFALTLIVLAILAALFALLGTLPDLAKILLVSSAFALVPVATYLLERRRKPIAA